LFRTKETVDGLRPRYSPSVLRLAWRGRDGSVADLFFIGTLGQISAVSFKSINMRIECDKKFDKAVVRFFLTFHEACDSEPVY
jgi:hypothetical protein